MSDAAPNGCPEPSTLAAYVEGSVDGFIRSDIERHIAGCPECPIVIAATARFLQKDPAAEDTDPRTDDLTARPRSWWWVAAVAAIAALCVPAIWFVTKVDPLRTLKQIAAESETRNVEGQLAEFGYAPFSAPRSGDVAPVNLALRAEAERLSGERVTDARALHAQGLALLLSGDTAAAVERIDKAVRRAPGNADLWNDLAVALIAEGSIGNAAHFTRALEAADRALQIQPELASAHLNRAIALERLGCSIDAVRAYERASALERQSQWRDEIALRISRLKH